jgi:ABC-type dipeptide/oligopeptide/nickel transport system permease component
VSTYIWSRLAVTVPVLVLVSGLVFFIMNLLPGDPAMLILQGQAASTPEQIDKLREQLNLDDPAIVRYGRFVAGAVRGDLGTSVQYKRPVTDVILERLPSTIQLAAAAMVVATVLGFSLGVLAALKHNTWVDTAAMIFSVLGLTMPIFYIGLLFILIFAVRLGWFPIIGGSTWERLVLPAVTLGFVLSGIIARLVRASLLEVLRQDYITTARAKGLRGRVVLWRHAIRNTLIPIVTILGLQIGGLLSGSVIIETVFDRPGVGRLAVEAITWKDFPLAQGTILFTATFYVLINLLVDISYAWFDPRIRYQ